MARLKLIATFHNKGALPKYINFEWQLRLLKLFHSTWVPITTMALELVSTRSRPILYFVPNVLTTYCYEYESLW